MLYTKNQISKLNGAHFKTDKQGKTKRHLIRIYTESCPKHPDTSLGYFMESGKRIMSSVKCVLVKVIRCRSAFREERTWPVPSSFIVALAGQTYRAVENSYQWTRGTLFYSSSTLLPLNLPFETITKPEILNHWRILVSNKGIIITVMRRMWGKTAAKNAWTVLLIYRNVF